MPNIDNPRDRNAMAFKAACAVLPAVYAKTAEDDGPNFKSPEVAQMASDIAAEIGYRLMTKFAGE